MIKAFKITGWVVSIIIFTVLGMLSILRRKEKLDEKSVWYNH